MYIEPMYIVPSRGPCIGTIYLALLGFGGIHLIILSYSVCAHVRARTCKSRHELLSFNYFSPFHASSSNLVFFFQFQSVIVEISSSNEMATLLEYVFSVNNLLFLFNKPFVGNMPN